MSRVRISNAPGGWLIEIPGFARSQGYGGEMVISAPVQSKQSENRAYYRANAERIKARIHHRTRCGRPMHHGSDFCDRAQGHVGHHSTRTAMDRVNAERRKAA